MQLVSTSFQPTAEIFTHRSFCSNTCFIFPIILLAFYLFLDFFQKRGYLVKKTDWTPQKLSVEVPESNVARPKWRFGMERATALKLIKDVIEYGSIIGAPLASIALQGRVAEEVLEPAFLYS